MDRQKAEAMLADATAELRTLRSAVSYLEQVVGGLQGLLQSQPLTQAQTPATPVAEEAPPAVRDEPAEEPVQEAEQPQMTSAEVVLTILRSHPNLPMAFPTVWQEIQDRGLVDPRLKAPRNTYGNAAQRLAEDPEQPVVRVDKKFVYRTDLAPSHFAAGSPLAQRDRPLTLAGTEPAWREALS